MNIAVYGGTFDPPTRAHEAIVEKLLQREDIDEVWVMPSAQRADKPGMTAQDDRLMLLEKMKEGSFGAIQKLVISTFEIDLLPPSETYRTYTALLGAFPEHQFMYVFGADSYADMPHWRGGQEMQQHMGVLLVARAGYDLPPENGHVKHLAVPEAVHLALSSSDVRKTVAEGGDIQDMVSSGVYDYIAQHDLYKTCTIQV